MEQQLTPLKKLSEQQNMNSNDRKSSYESFGSNDKNTSFTDEWPLNQHTETPFDHNREGIKNKVILKPRTDFNDYEIDFDGDGDDDFAFENDGLKYPENDTSQNTIFEPQIDHNILDNKKINESDSLIDLKFRNPDVIHQISVSFDHNEGQLHNIVYYLVKGHVIHLGTKKELEAKRRFSDFVFLYKLLVNKYYYKVLPLLPEKNKLLKIMSNKELIDKRSIALELFLKQVINIESVFEFEPFTYFLFKGQELQLLYERPEYKEITAADGLFEKSKGIATQLVSMVTGEKTTYDRGYYSNFHREVETLFLFTSNFIENLTKLDNNMNTIFKNISGFVESSRKVVEKEVTRNYESMSEVLIKKYHSNKKNTKSYVEVIRVLKMINEDLQACKEALDRKDSIHKDYARIAKELQNESQRNNQMYVAKKYHLEALKQKIDLMEVDLKADLTRHLKVVNKRIVEVFRDKMQQVFVDLYRLN